MKCGLLGRKLSHSYSPAIHSLLGDYEYALFEKEPEELEAFLRSEAFDGINVTMPYKQQVIAYLDKLSPVAQQIGAVNTIYHRNGMLCGHNTDYHGFEAMLNKSGVDPRGKKCLILGSGGASKVVSCVLERYGASVVIISRTGEHNYENITQHHDAAIIVNATPVGMYPDTGVSAVNLNDFSSLEAVLDVVYNPARTKLLMDAEEKGIPAMNGLWMLIAQAQEASAVMTGIPVPDGRTEEIYEILRRQMENIVLIGMPGCGKTTVGRLVAKELGKTFVDCDAEIEKRAEKSIPRIFAEDGESAFRRWESQVLEDLGKRSGLVLATGGGCVTQRQNYPLLHQNGTIFWLQRELSKLPTEGRPLSLNHDLTELYQARKALYEAFADETVDNNTTPEQAACAILEKMK